MCVVTGFALVVILIILVLLTIEGLPMDSKLQKTKSQSKPQMTRQLDQTQSSGIDNIPGQAGSQSAQDWSKIDPTEGPGTEVFGSNG